MSIFGGFGTDGDTVKAGTTSDGRTIRIERSGSGFVLKSPGSAPKYSKDFGYLEQEMKKIVPPGRFFENY